MSAVNQIQPSLVWRRTLRVAAYFWTLCLLLVSIEAVYGANNFAAVCFLLSVPALVGYLIWANRHLLAIIRRGLLSAIGLSMFFLLTSTLIVFIGLYAAAHLKRLLLGA